MKNGSTLFLKIALFFLSVPGLALYIFGLPHLLQNPANPKYAHLLYPIAFAVFLAVIPYFTALIQAFKLLSHIDKNEAFTILSVKCLKIIKYCGIAIASIFIVLTPFIFMLAQSDDAPGLVLIGLGIIFGSLIITVFAAVLQRLLHDAIIFKSENELTV